MTTNNRILAAALLAFVDLLAERTLCPERMKPSSTVKFEQLDEPYGYVPHLGFLPVQSTSMSSTTKPSIAETLKAIPANARLREWLHELYTPLYIEASALPEDLKAFGAGSRYHVAVLSPPRLHASRVGERPAPARRSHRHDRGYPGAAQRLLAVRSGGLESFVHRTLRRNAASAAAATRLPRMFQCVSRGL